MNQIGIGASVVSRLGLQESGALAPLQEGSGSVSFAETLKAALGEVSDLQVTAQDAIGAFLRGDPIETHQVMAAAEEAGIALELLIEIRNKLTEAYRTVMQMQS